jgi:ABC-2 type transport system permease protein
MSAGTRAADSADLARSRHAARGTGPSARTRGTGEATGTWRLLRFALRRDRVRLPLWIAAAAGFVAVQSVASQGTYDDPGALAAYEQAAQSSAAVIAMTGRPVGLDSVARAVAFEIFAVVAIVVALMSVFTLVRHTRADEAEGRTELVRATAVGRRAPLLAALALVGLANLAVVLAVWAVGVGTGLPSTGSLVLGVSLGGVGLVLGGVTAVGVQLVESPRAATAIGGAATGAAFVLRAVGDVQENVLSWLSPFGWGQAMYPFHLDRWWPVLLSLTATAVLVVLAVALADRRDLGAGLLAGRPGPSGAGRLLSGPVGLAWRLQRGTVAGWTAGILVTGLAYGSLVVATEDLVEQIPEILEMLPGGADRIVAGYLVLATQLVAFLAACAGVAMVQRLRTEELAGRAEPLLATPTSRWSWAGSHVLVALLAPAVALGLGCLVMGVTAVATGVDDAVVGDVMRAGLVLLPAAWVLVGLAVAVWGADARLGPLAWLAVAWAGVVFVLADSLEMPGWLRGVSPFHHVPLVPVEDPTAGGPLALLGLAAALVLLGLALWRRRDLRTS